MCYTSDSAVFIAERLSARHLILLQSQIVSLYACMYVVQSCDMLCACALELAVLSRQGVRSMSLQNIDGEVA